MPDIGISSFSTFGELLKYLRRRAQLTQRELAIAVGYTEGHLSRLEKNQRSPDPATVAALFVPALGLEEEPETTARLMALAAAAHAGSVHRGENLTVSRVQETIEIRESAESIPSNLPIQLTTFIGRVTEVTELTGLLSRTNPARLITLTGPGGMGKTRLALQTTMGLTHHYPDGVWFIDLTALSAPELIPQTIASTWGVSAAQARSSEESLIASLRSKQILLVLDNCEHLVQSTAQLVEKILRSCAGVQVLATSRELLNVPGEVNFQVAPLSLPERPDSTSQTLMAYESVQLFIERARNLQPSLMLDDASVDIIGRICRQLDGMPLAIELAAARTSLLSLSQIESRLSDRLQFLTGGSVTVPRHQTLRAAIEWSHELLGEAEKVLFRRLAVFAGGWTLDAANAVCSNDRRDVLDLLAQLVTKSLVVVERQLDGQVRYRMLESLREYAHEQLRICGETEQLRARHFDYFLEMAQQGEPKLFTEERFIDSAEREIDNLRAALTWTLETDADRFVSEERSGRALELMLHVWPLWLSRGYSREGKDWLNRLLAVHAAPTPARARALLLAGDLAGMQDDYEKQSKYFQESLGIARQLSDKKRIAWALMELGSLERDRDYPKALEFLTESLGLFQELNENLWLCRTFFVLAQTHLSNGNLSEAKLSWEQGLALSRAENDKWQIAWGLEGLGDVERLSGNFERTRELYRESLELKLVVMDKAGIAYSLEAFAQLAVAQEQFERAAMLWGAAEQFRKTLTSPRDLSREEPHRSLIETARTQLGAESFEMAWAKGRAWKLQEAVDYALSFRSTN